MQLLNDHQVSQFITDGMITLQPDVDPELHQTIEEKLRFATEHEFPAGNNILSRVPEMWEVLRSPNVRGALTGLLGPNYYVHPHRAIHTSKPVEDKSLVFERDHNGPPMGKGSMAGSGWHQDAQSPLSRARHHTPKYLIGFYFPHDTPEVMGPTRVQAGSYLFSEPHAPTGVVLPDHISAGTLVLLHFDMVHAAWPNRTDQTRYMIKFVFTRTEHPKIATWFNQSQEWPNPTKRLCEVDLSPAWRHIWHWLRGEPNSEALESMDLEGLNSMDESIRMRSTYAKFDDREVQNLSATAVSVQGQGLHERRKASDQNGNAIPRDHVIGGERRWNERAIVFDDAFYALSSVGDRAIQPLCEMAEHADPWVRLSAAFTLGEIGPKASGAMPTLVALLKSTEQQVVRQTLDAIASIGEGMDSAFDLIEQFLTTTNEDWQEPEVMRGWTGEDQIRLNAAFALLSALNYDNDLGRIERLFIQSLGDPNGYVSAVAAEGLTRLGTTTSHAAVIRFLQDRRWDDTLMGRRKPF